MCFIVWPCASAHCGLFQRGNATHLGRTGFVIEQWWTKAPNPVDGISYGQGKITFTAANGDELYATYFGTADHTYDGDGTEILTHGIFTGGTGRFVNPEGTFEWDGLFFRTLPGPPSFPVGEVLGSGEVTVTGMIKY